MSEGFKGFRAGTMKEKCAQHFYGHPKAERQEVLKQFQKYGCQPTTAASWYAFFKTHPDGKPTKKAATEPKAKPAKKATAKKAAKPKADKKPAQAAAAAH